MKEMAGYDESDIMAAGRCRNFETSGSLDKGGHPK